VQAHSAPAKTKGQAARAAGSGESLNGAKHLSGHLSGHLSEHLSEQLSRQLSRQFLRQFLGALLLRVVLGRWLWPFESWAERKSLLGNARGRT